MVKLAWLYHGTRGKPTKRKIIARDRSFHGSTIAAASMCGLDFMHREFGLPLPGFLHTPAPNFYRTAQSGEDESAFVARLVHELETLILREGPDTIAAFIAEPIQAGGGIIVPPASYFPEVHKLLRKYDILGLADEIVCGFGRTGKWFGEDTTGLAPDMMALAKGLSAGHFPISAVVMSAPIYDAVKAFNAAGGNFGHGFTNSGHPVGVAVALEVIRIYEEMEWPPMLRPRRAPQPSSPRRAKASTSSSTTPAPDRARQSWMRPTPNGISTGICTSRPPSGSPAACIR